MRKLLLLLSILLPLVASAYDAKIDGIYYNFSGNEAEVTYQKYQDSYPYCISDYSGDVVIPESFSYNSKTYKVTSIGNYAFYYCTSLTSITIPEGVTTIGYKTFYGCSGLTSITIPDGVTSIGGYAFYYCSSLTSITIPNSVTSIGISAFAGCSGLTSITIPNSVTSIGNSAFSSCSSLTSITIPNSVTSIGTYAFNSCSSLTSITIPEGVTTIGYKTFYGCSGLTSITIPNSVTIIGEYAFYECSGLTSVTIPNSVKTIGNYAFVNCTSLTSITIPNSVTSIGNNAFGGCYFASSSFVNNCPLTSDNNWGAVICDEETTDGLLIKDNSVVECRKWATSVTIPNGVTSIGEYAFGDCSSLISITIPESVTSIGESAFYGCSSLTSVSLNSNSITSANYSASSNIGTIFGSQVKEYVLGNEIKRIGNYAFAGSTELVSIAMGRTINRIQEYAFSGCGKLEEVRVENPEPPIAFENAFHANAYYAVLYVPEGSQAEYKEDNVWKKFSRIRTFKDEPEECILTIKSAIGGYVEMKCKTQTNYTFTVKAEDGWLVSGVSFNGEDVTASITEGTYTTPLLEGDSELNVVFEQNDDDLVNEIEANELRVMASGATIYIHNESVATNASIYSTDGKLVKYAVVPYGMTMIPMQADNVYIVKIGTHTFKVLM